MRFLHTMLRVSNLDAALDFYVNKLGLKETRRRVDEKNRYTLVFLVGPDDVDAVEASKKRGRPGPEVGPLYALEIQAAGPSLTFYWPRVPAERSREVGGAARVYWRGGDAQLEACRTCHAAGLADPAKRSRWRPARRND